MTKNLKIIIFSILCFSFLVLCIFGLSKIKVDDFKKAAVIFLVDASASNQANLQKERLTIRQLCGMLDPEDHIKILRVSENSYLIYEGSPQAFSEINKSMESFTKYDEKEYGTAYGLSMKKAFNHVRNMKSMGYIPSIVVLGDLENEGNTENQIDWKTFPNEVKTLKTQIPEFSMMFLFAAPEKLDVVKETLTPVLGEEKLIVAPETTVNKAMRRFLAAIGR